MKSLVLILFSLLFLNSQTHDQTDLCIQLIKQIDKEDFESVEDINLTNNGKGFELHLLLSGKSLLMNFKVIGGGKCVDDNEEMTVIFTDRTGLTMTNDNSFNCEGVYTQHFGEDFGKKKELKKFLAKEIQSIRITTDGDPVDMVLTTSQSKRIKDTMNCLNTKI